MACAEQRDATHVDFAADLQAADASATPHQQVERALAHALRSRWDRAAAVVRCACDFLLLDTGLARLSHPEAAGDDASARERPAALLDAAVEQAASNELFAALVQSGPVNDLRIERLLLAMRERLIAALPDTPDARRVAALIATQARWVEYLWPDARPQSPAPAGTAGSARSRGLQALAHCMVQPPAAADIAALAALEDDTAVRELLALIRDEPAIEARYRTRLEQSGFDAAQRTARFADGRAATAQRGAPRNGTRADASAAAERPRAVPQPVRALARGERFERPRVLLVGCGDARDPVTLQATWPGAHVIAIDWSATRLVHAMRTWESAGALATQAGTVEFIATDLLDVPARSGAFDVVQCAANAHYLPHPLAGCTTVARCMQPGGLLRLVVFSEGARRHLHALQAALEARSAATGVADLRALRGELLAGGYGALPAELLEHPDFFTASGMRRMLFAHDDDVPEPAGWIRLAESVGFSFVCVEPNEALTHAARSAGFHQCDAWSMRDWERFERGRPPMFGGEYALWFVRGERFDSRIETE
jgi:SAM-dependent methyltransferase